MKWRYLPICYVLGLFGDNNHHYTQSCSKMFVFTDSLSDRQDAEQGKPLNWVKLSFPSPRPVAKSKLVSSQPYCLSIAGGCIPFPKVLVQYERQTASSRIWTLVTMPISYDDNRYTTICSKMLVFQRFPQSLCQGEYLWCSG